MLPGQEEISDVMIIEMVYSVTSPAYQGLNMLVNEISQLVNKMCSHCLFPVVDKSGTSCYHLGTRLMRPTDSQQVVPTSLISSARNKLLTS